MHAPEFWRRDGLVPRLLSPASSLWRAGSAVGRWRAAPERVDAPVICVGNAVAGGAGKTPVALAVARRLIAGGAAPHFLSRGYGGTRTGPVRVDPARDDAATVGDEPLLLAAVAPVWVARDRAAGARAAVEAGAGVIVMDDGYQNFALAKDVSLLVIDGGYGFGNNRLMPAGPLREPVADALARADAVAILGEDRVGIADMLPADKPVLAARFVPVMPDADDIAGHSVVAFAGIGRPEKFFETLAGMGCKILETHGFADHHRYSADEVMRIVDAAAAGGAVPVTTEKDAMRLPAEARDMVKVLRVDLEWRDADALDNVLARVLQQAC